MCLQNVILDSTLICSVDQLRSKPLFRLHYAGNLVYLDSTTYEGRVFFFFLNLIDD